MEKLKYWVTCPNCQDRTQYNLEKKKHGYICPDCGYEFMFRTIEEIK